MRIPNDVLALSQLLDRQAQHILEPADARAFIALSGFLEFLEREPRLNGLVSDLTAEADAHWNDYESECEAVLEELRAIHGASERALARLRARDKKNQCHWEEYDGLVQRLRRKPAFVRTYSTNRPDAVHPEHFWLTHFVQCGYDHEASEWRERSLKNAANRLVLLGERLARAWTTRRLRVESEGGTAYRELRTRADQLVPTTTDSDQGFLAAVHNLRAREMWEILEHNIQFAGFEKAQKDAPFFSDTISLVRTLVLALQTKLAEGWSRVAVVRRYVARCQTYDRARLLGLMKANAGKIEDVLTLDFARFLFDLGFNPIVDPQVAGLRPDLLDPTLTPAVYVEAKQYLKPTLANLQKNVAQVFDTWGRLRNQYDLPEAFLLVFRRGGRLVEFPPFVDVKGRRLRLHVVDLAPASKTGSRAGESPLVVTEAELIGLIGSTRQRLTRRRSRRRHPKKSGKRKTA